MSQLIQEEKQAWLIKHHCVEWIDMWKKISDELSDSSDERKAEIGYYEVGSAKFRTAVRALCVERMSHLLPETLFFEDSLNRFMTLSDQDQKKEWTRIMMLILNF